ncbi:hypothetical protein [Kitasatospora sp. NPDC002040]|uniref:hypothetical protein n=1 Tax=Kitasatospora sp. NPDC002040 TaxID=3154661 RepID=UPI0033197262
MSSDQKSDQEFEAELASALTRVGATFRTETARLDAVGLERGRRAWRRRRAGTALGTALALALVGGSVYLVALGGPAVSTGPAISSEAPVPPNPSGTRSAAPSSTRTSGPVLVPTERVLTALRASLPTGTFSGVEGLEDQDIEIDGAMVSLRFDDGRGVSAVSVSVTRRAPRTAAAAQQLCVTRSGGSAEGCRTSTLADGSVLTVFQGLEFPDGRADTKLWSAVLSGPDGRLIELTEWNAPASKGEPVSRPAPPLTADQLTAAVTSRAWDPIVAVLPPARGEVSASRLPSGQIVLIASKLLPAGLVPAHADPGGSGEAHFTVDDGAGASLVEIGLQHWPDPGTLREQDRPPGWRTLADGSWLWETEEGTNPRHRRVEAVRRDGIRVVVSAYNSGAVTELATRQAPVLTVEQMRAIALSPAWTTADG